MTPVPRAQSFTVFSACSRTLSHLPSRQLCSAYLVGCSGEQTETAVEWRADTGSYYCDPRFIDEDTNVLGCAQSYRQ